MTSLAKMLSVLELFSAEHPQWSAEDICESLDFSRPTGYRYVKELVEVGLLQRVANGYVLGPRIILLDYHIRMADPILRASIPMMRELVEKTGCDCVLSALYGTQLLDIHREAGSEHLDLTYGRGRPRPLFQGAAPKVILAFLPRARLKKIYDTFSTEIGERGLGKDWNEFRANMAKVRKTGHYLSLGELEAKLSGVAAPLLASDGSVMGAISLVTSTERMQLLDRTLLTDLIQNAASFVSLQISALPVAPPAPDATATPHIDTQRRKEKVFRDQQDRTVPPRSPRRHP